MILAKPVIPDQYWILQQDDRKVGNILAERGGFRVVIHGNEHHVTTLGLIQPRIPIRFQDRPQTLTQPSADSVMGYPALGPVHNPTWNCRLRAPQYTRDSRSRSWWAAGWWLVDEGAHRRVRLCPKLIVLERRPHQGPFQTREAADAALA